MLLSVILSRPENSGRDFFMTKTKADYSFWTKYKRFATTEILMYLIMVVGILLGIIIFS